jgi:hypothetical protein
VAEVAETTGSTNKPAPTDVTKEDTTMSSTGMTNEATSTGMTALEA